MYAFPGVSVAEGMREEKALPSWLMKTLPSTEPAHSHLQCPQGTTPVLGEASAWSTAATLLPSHPRGLSGQGQMLEGCCCSGCCVLLRAEWGLGEPPPLEVRMVP